MKKLKINKKLIIFISIITLLIGVSIGIGIFSYNKKQEANQTEPSIKKCPYTLEEIYEITSDYNKFKKENKKGVKNDLAYTLIHFYDYFSKSTPFPEITLYFDEKTKEYIGIKDITYIDYYEYSKKMEWIHKLEKEKIEECNQASKKEETQFCTFAYMLFAENAVYKVENIKGENK